MELAIKYCRYYLPAWKSKLYFISNPYVSSFHCVKPFQDRYYSKSYASREARYMNKLLSKNLPGRKANSFGQLTKPTNSGSGKTHKYANSRRITVLNKLFMEYITDILVTGNVGHDLISRDIQITKVDVTPDLNSINVFWVSPPLNEDIDSILSGIARKMYHELTQLRLMGTVPNVVFVKDTRREKLREVETLISKISMDNKNNERSYEIVDDENEKVPEMTNNIYGLDHQKIMKKANICC